jgi:hypothetical protein
LQGPSPALKPDHNFEVTSLPSSGFSLRRAIQPGVLAVKRNWAPFLAIQLAMFGLVASYYNLEAVRNIAEVVAQWKVAGGLLFSFIVGAFAGGLIPECAKLLTGRLRSLNAKWAKDSMFNALVYGVVGAQVDLFYRLQSFMWGDSTAIPMLLWKTFIDMAFFSTLVSMPTAVLLFEWRKAGFKISQTIRQPFGEFYLQKVVPTVLPAWAFWTPVLLGVYAMPLNLQLPLSMLAEAAWSIVFVFIATMPDPDLHPPA